MIGLIVVVSAETVSIATVHARVSIEDVEEGFASGISRQTYHEMINLCVNHVSFQCS